jgi:hypothetical protein
MMLRISPELHAKMKLASDIYRVSYSEMARMALRRYRNQTNVWIKVPRPRYAGSEKPAEPEQKRANARSTYGGIPIRLDIPATLIGDKEPAELRQIIEWYLDQHDFKPQSQFETDLIEGQDYNIVSEF